MKQEYNLIYFMGLPGCGKGTHAKEVAQQYNIKSFSPGEMFANLPTTHHHYGAVQAHMNKGNFVPDDILFELALPWYFENPGTIICDGLARTKEQHQRLQSELSPASIRVIHFNMSTERAVEWMRKRNRPNETQDVIAKRVKNYNTNTVPLINQFYKHSPIVFQVDADPYQFRGSQQESIVSVRKNVCYNVERIIGMNTGMSDVKRMVDMRRIQTNY